MRVVTREIFARLRFDIRGDIRPQRQLRGIVKGAVFFRRSEVGIMRRPPREPEQERLRALRPRAEKGARIARLVERVVAGPVEFFRRVAVENRVGVVVRAFEHLPVVEALAALRRDEGRAAMPVDVPFANRRRVVARGLEHFRQRDRGGIERHVIEKNAVCERALAGEQRGARGRADGHPCDGVNAAHALAREAVEVRRPHVRIAGKTERLRAPLVGEHDDDIRRLRAGRGDEKGGEKNAREK